MFNVFSNRSYSWKKCRQNHIKNNPYCSACGTDKSLQVHHIEPFHISPEKELNTDNLITLCSSCHFIFGHLMDWKSWNKDVVVDSKVYLNKVQNKPIIIKAQNDKNNNFYNYCFYYILKLISWNNRS